MSASEMAPGFRALSVPSTQVSLAVVLKCGQSFRWSAYPLKLATADPRAPTHEYRLCLRDRVVCLRQSPDKLYYRALYPSSPSSASNSSQVKEKAVDEEERDAETRAWVEDFFQLARVPDVRALRAEWAARDAVLAVHGDRFVGVRVLRQDPWETLISFICSANNNIARISKMVRALCTHFSPPLAAVAQSPLGDEEAPEAYHPFPPPSRLAAADVAPALRALGFGYRAEYIQKTAKMLVDANPARSPNAIEEGAQAWLRGLRRVPTDEVRAELVKLSGVGRKVADCVMLMSLDKTEVVPVDTHVHQIAVRHYGFRAKQALSPRLYDEISTKFVVAWGKYAGWAHTILFTADLKAFSTFGLPTPESTPPLSRVASSSSVKRKSKDEEEEDSLPVPVRVVSPSNPSRSQRRYAPPAEGENKAALVESDGAANSLVDRVKRRRRTTVKTES